MSTRDWGAEAIALLDEIKNPHARRKRSTLIALADAVLDGQPFARVWERRDCASDNAHYRWLTSDPAYKLAYNHLVGDPSAPGLARQQYEAMTDQMEADAVTAVARARHGIRINSEEAVMALVKALEANRPLVIDGEVRDYPDTTNRVAAAKALLDRLPETAPASKQDITSGGEKLPATFAIAGIDSILAKIYGEEGDDTDDSTDETADGE